MPTLRGRYELKTAFPQTIAPTSAVPAGSVFYFASSSAPTGYLKANGDTVPNGSGTVQGVTADFSALYAILGSTYGSAGQLPDLRGEFIRGFDDGREVDPDHATRAFGSSQSWAIQNITGSIARIAGMVAVIGAGLAQVATISRQKFQTSSAKTPINVGGGGASGEHSHAINLWQFFASQLGKGRIIEVSAALDYIQTEDVDYDKLCLLHFKTETGLIGRVVQDVITSPARKWARIQALAG